MVWELSEHSQQSLSKQAFGGQGCGQNRGRQTLQHLVDAATFLVTAKAFEDPPPADSLNSLQWSSHGCVIAAGPAVAKPVRMKSAQAGELQFAGRLP